jgi:hypothetical protein
MQYLLSEVVVALSYQAVHPEAGKVAVWRSYSKPVCLLLRIARERKINQHD